MADIARITVTVELPETDTATYLESTEEALCMALDSWPCVLRYTIRGEWLEGTEMPDVWETTDN